MPRLRAFVSPVAAEHFVDHINSHGTISNAQTLNSISVTINLDLSAYMLLFRCIDNFAILFR